MPLLSLKRLSIGRNHGKSETIRRLDTWYVANGSDRMCRGDYVAAANPDFAGAAQTVQGALGAVGLKS